MASDCDPTLSRTGSSNVVSRMTDEQRQDSSRTDSGVQVGFVQVRPNHKTIMIPDSSTLHDEDWNGGDVAFNITSYRQRSRRGVGDEVNYLSIMPCLLCSARLAPSFRTRYLGHGEPVHFLVDGELVSPGLSIAPLRLQKCKRRKVQKRIG